MQQRQPASVVQGTGLQVSLMGPSGLTGDPPGPEPVGGSLPTGRGGLLLRLTSTSGSVPASSADRGRTPSKSPLGSTATVGRFPTYRYKFQSPASNPSGSAEIHPCGSASAYQRART